MAKITSNFNLEALDSAELNVFYQNIFNTSYDGIHVCDKYGNTILFNEAFLQISGLDVEFLHKYNVYQLVEENLVPKSVSVEVLKTKYTTSMMIDYYSGKKTIVTSKPIFDENNEISCVVTNVRDISELNRLQKELEETRQTNTLYKEKLNKMQEQLKNDHDFVYRSKLMDKIVSTAQKFSQNDSPVLILGESGVGKDELAKLIHVSSNRKGGFIRINCGAIPNELLESELFGYEKGAFTGATSAKAGLFELAHEGTIFLDEIGDLPHPLQVKLLNVLQEQKIRRLGGTKTYNIDMRVIAATNSDLLELIKQKKFRLDLYYRLNVLSLEVPPLKDRREDIPELVFHFFRQLQQKYQVEKRVDADTLEDLVSYDWPGNIRELKNIVERIYHMSEGDVITRNVLPSFIRNQKRNGNGVSFNYQEMEQAKPLKHVLQQFEKEYIEHALKKSSTVKECAQKLEIDISTLIRKKKNLGIS